MAEKHRDHLLVGAKQFRKSLRAGTVSRVYLAKNADPAVTGPVEDLCRQNRIEYVWVKTMNELGRACGIEIGAAVATVTK